MLGCVFLGSGDWLMMYGSTAYHGDIYWLTEGVAQISAWRNSLSMLVAFPAILLYGIALFATVGFVKKERNRKFPKGMAFTNVLVIYGILWLAKSAMPDTPFRIGFTNGLMSESMILWFGIMLVWVVRHMKESKAEG